METLLTAVFISEPPTGNEDTEKFVPLQPFEIVLTVVESKNPYLNGKQTWQPMQVPCDIAEMMFQQVLTEYEVMDGGHPFVKVGDWKWKGRFAGEMVTLELVG